MPSPRSAAVVALAVAAYAVAVLVLLPRFGPPVMIVAFAPVVAIAATLGATAGVLTTAILAGLTALLWNVTGTAPGEAIVRVGSGVGLVIGIPLAWVIGRLRDARQELARQHTALEGAAARQLEDIQDVVREMTTPLSAIELTARRASDDPAAMSADTAHAIAEEAAKARELLRTLSDGSQIQVGEIRVIRQRIDLIGLAQETLAAFDAHGRRLVLSAPPGLRNVFVRGDRVALGRVIRELLSNAVLYSRRGPVTLEVSALDEMGVAKLTVHDTGRAIAHQERSQLFRKFSRLSSAGGTSGAGLGLWLSRLIIEAHGGRLEASWPREGNEFTVTLPLAVDEATPATP